jgi:membrane protein implicated in regulation of membrane protease activity
MWMCVVMTISVSVSMPVTMSVPVVVSVVVLMAVVPQLGFVEQKEKNQPHQQRQKQLMGTGFAFESFGQQMQKRRGHQGPGGHA